MMTVKATTTDVYPIQIQERAVMKHAFLIGCKCCAFLVGQEVLQMSQISKSCVIISMSY